MSGISGIKMDRVILLGALSYVYFYAVLVHLAKSEKYSRGFVQGSALAPLWRLQRAPDDKFRAFGTQFLQHKKPICPNNSWISPCLLVYMRITKNSWSSHVIDTSQNIFLRKNKIIFLASVKLHILQQSIRIDTEPSTRSLPKENIVSF